MLRQKLRTKDLHKNVVFGQKTGEFTIQHQLRSHQQPKFPATTYAWFLHDHLGSTVAAYGSSENGEIELTSVEKIDEDKYRVHTLLSHYDFCKKDVRLCRYGQIKIDAYSGKIRLKPDEYIDTTPKGNFLEEMLSH